MLKLEVTEAFLNAMVPAAGLINGKIEELTDLELSFQGCESYDPKERGIKVTSLEPGVQYKALYKDTKGKQFSLALSNLFFAKGDLAKNLKDVKAFDKSFPAEAVEAGLGLRVPGVG